MSTDYLQKFFLVVNILLVLNSLCKAAPAKKCSKCNAADPKGADPKVDRNVKASDPKTPDANSKDGADKKKESKQIEFVSMRCGITGKWNQAAQVCMPFNNTGSDENDNSASEEVESTTKPPSADNPIENRAATDSKEIVISEERVKWQIITIMCGIGYRYLKKEKICRAMEYDGHDETEHQRTDRKMKGKPTRRRRSLIFGHLTSRARVRTRARRRRGIFQILME